MTQRVEHLSDFGQFTPRPLPFRPSIVGGLAARMAATEGSISRVATEFFAERGVVVEAVDLDGARIPDDKLPSADGRGTLLIGCHRHGTEPAFMASLLGRNDVDMHVFAKPPSMQAQGLASVASRLAETDERAARRVMGAILPITTARIGRDAASPKHWQRILWMLGKRQQLPLSGEVTANNVLAMRKGAERLEQGDAVVIFPSGQIVGANKRPWNRGVASVLAAIGPDRRSRVDVQFFRAENYPSLRYVGAVALGLPLPNRPVRIALSPPERAADILPHDTHAHNLKAITASLHERFRVYFSDDC